MENNNKKTDRDFKPTQGQESNERWDDANLGNTPGDVENTSDDDEKQGLGARRMDEQTNTTGYGSSQRRATDTAAGSVGPLDSDLNELPSQKRRNRS